jgi:hypothetical protein
MLTRLWVAASVPALTVLTASLIAGVAAPAADTVQADTIKVENAGAEVGLLIDGASIAGSAVNDLARVQQNQTNETPAAVTIEVGRLTRTLPPARNEAIVFGPMRAPRRADMAWTPGTDRLKIALANPVDIAFTVWIVQGPFASQRDHAYASCIFTMNTWRRERTGLRISACDIRDATNDPDITYAVLNSIGGDRRNWDDFPSRIGFDKGRINIYWINTVEGLTTMGWSDFGSRIVMGANTGYNLLAHELGHSFSLFHPVNCGTPSAIFDDRNIMWQCSDDREHATEGQIFRMHFNPTSAVNEIYAARPGEPTENCLFQTSQTPACPALERRLWSDGIFPPN